MKAMVLHELGGPENLGYDDVPEPEPGPGETVVRLHAAARNRRDVFATRGQYPGARPEALPVILGSDGSGEVVARGDGARGPDEGTEVVINPPLYWVIGRASCRGRVEISVVAVSIKKKILRKKT